MTAPFTLLTWNINGIRARLDGVLTYLAEREPDVVCLQEIKCEEKVFPRVPFMELGYQLQLHGSKGYAGVATLSKQKPSEVIKGFREAPLDSHCRILNTVIGGVRIYNLYVPNGTALGTEAFTYKLQWLERLRQELDASARADEPLLLCGDFNIAPDARDLVDPASMVGCTHFSPEEHAALAKLQAFGLRDCFRKFNEEAGQFTWFDYRAGAFRKNQGMRIDLVYATAPLYERCVEVVHDATPRSEESPSDHIPVLAKFS
ncbi:MAG: exodeoxyribonuclease III [Nannocystis sp.]|nr:exodeoxyribonuclease III [Nannocystis sp.]MBA3549587.1 exodeoxyribonuclease III [Nannocystis sp.]